MVKDSIKLIELLEKAGAKECLYVGGCVRDWVLKIEPKDLDIEVYGLDFDKILKVLKSEYESVKTVGKAFGIIKVNNLFDVSVPRRDNKIGRGHKDFEAILDPNMSVKEAAMRRDFTINSMAMSKHGEVVDPFYGQRDLRERKLRATSDLFVEDPLRVLRGMQFAGRFGFEMTFDTIMLCRYMVDQFDALAKERVLEEWWKWAELSKVPSCGLTLLMQTHWVEHWPIIRQLQSVPQDPVWHPEGNCLLHTMHTVDAAAKIADRDNVCGTDRAILVLAALCHDFGKIVTTVKNAEGRWTAPAHAEMGVGIADDFLKSIGVPVLEKHQILKLVAEHMAHTGTEPTERNVRRLSVRLAPTTIQTWSRVVEADNSGRPPLPPNNPSLPWLKVAEEIKIKDSVPKPILLGRHLIEMGLKPGPQMGSLLKKAYQVQLDGGFNDLDHAIEWAKGELVEQNKASLTS